MQFQVPQFIEVEDKIFGPFTFKQFIWMGGGLGSAYILWRILPSFLALPLILGVLGLTAALAFFQFNGRPFITALENAFYYFIRPRLYLWNNERKPSVVKEQMDAALKPSDMYIPKLTDGRLHELAWSLDIKEKIASGSAGNDDRAVYDAMRPIKTARDALVR